jgi:hypothetical protein
MMIDKRVFEPKEGRKKKSEKGGTSNGGRFAATQW